VGNFYPLFKRKPRVSMVKLENTNELSELIIERAKVQIEVKIEETVCEAEGIMRYVLGDLRGQALEPFDAGAHIDIFLDDDLMRPYSLCGDPMDDHHYQIAVLRDEKGRGGSKTLHEEFQAGGTVTISTPRNHFQLVAGASQHLLLAGGIGVTPMIAMIYELEARGEAYEMHFCTRSPATTPFKNFLAPRIKKGHVHVHHDNGDPSQGLDIVKLLREQPSGSHLYFCGPSGFMDATKSAAAHWGDGTLHSEYFTAPLDNNNGNVDNTAFQVKIKSTSEVYDIPADKSIVCVLRDNGIIVDTQCEDGYCGTCLTRYVDGKPDHRDTVLDDDDREQFLMICCSRSKSALLVLDI
jgi:ferredoxin-NADP reductase